MRPRNSPSNRPAGRPLLGALAGALLVLASPAWAGEVPYVERSDEELLLLAVKLDGEVIEAAMTAYPSGDDVILPLGGLSRLLGLAIEVDPVNAIASGFFISEQRTFRLDARTGVVTIEGKPHQAAPGELELHEDELFVSRAALQRWLPIDLVVDRHAAIVTVQPREPLPLQLQRERALKMQAAMANLKRYSGVDLPRVPLAHDWFDGPFVDQTVQLRLAQGANDAEAITDVRSSSYLTGELLFLDASAYLSGGSTGFGEARVRLGRRDPERGLLGPLGATEVAVGEVGAPGLDLISRPTSGTGLVLSNYPLDIPTEYDRHTFRGDLPPGWEIELYRNDALLGFQTSRDDGLYEFVDVPLLFGRNEFRRVFHGPHGERREEVDRFDVGQQQTPPGELRYRLIGQDPRTFSPRASLELELGLGRHLSASAAAAVLQDETLFRRFGKVGLRGFWSTFSAAADVATELSGGTVAQGQLRTTLGPVGISAEHLQLWAYDTERITSPYGPLQSRSGLKVDAAIPLPWQSRLPFTLEAGHDRLVSGEWVNTFGGRVSAFYRGFAASQRLTWHQPQPGSNFSNEGIGSALISYSLPTISVRAQIDHRIAPTSELISAGLVVDARLLPGYSVSASTSYSAAGMQYSVGLGKREGMIGYNLNAGYSREGGVNLGLVLTFAVGREPRSNTWKLRDAPLAGSGAASVRAFLDKNGNEALDEGEEVLPEVGFSVNGAFEDEDRTGPDGSAFLSKLPVHRPVDITLVGPTLEDPFWRPTREGIRFVPRPGKVLLVDFPVTVSGEVFGTVYLSRGGESKPLAGVELELVDSEGKVAQTVRSAFDGFYDLADIRPGKYSIRFPREQMIKLKILPPFPKKIVIAPDGTVLENLDFVLESTAPAPSRSAAKS